MGAVTLAAMNGISFGYARRKPVINDFTLLIDQRPTVLIGPNDAGKADDPELVVGQLVADIAGFGPLQQFLDDEEVEEIWINEPTRVFAARRGRSELTSVMLTTEQVHELVERMLSSSGRRLDGSGSTVV